MTLGRSFHTRFIAGLLLGLCAVGAVFGVASAAASNLVVSFAVAESASHRRNADFAASTAHPAFDSTSFLKHTPPRKGKQQ